MAKLGEATVAVRLDFSKTELLKLQKQLANFTIKTPTFAKTINRAIPDSNSEIKPLLRAILAQLRASDKPDKTKIQQKNKDKSDALLRKIENNTRGTKEGLRSMSSRLLKLGIGGAAALGVNELIGKAFTFMNDIQREGMNQLQSFAQQTAMYSGTYRSFAGKTANKTSEARFVKFNQALETNQINTGEVAESVNQFQNWLKTADESTFNDDLLLAKKQIEEGTLGATDAYMRLLKDWFKNDELRASLPDEALGGTDITKRYRGLTTAGQQEVINAIDGRGYDVGKVTKLIDSTRELNQHMIDNQRKFIDAMTETLPKSIKQMEALQDSVLKNQLANIEMTTELKNINTSINNMTAWLKHFFVEQTRYGILSSHPPSDRGR